MVGFLGMGHSVRQEKVRKDCERAGEQQVMLNLATGGIWSQTQRMASACQDLAVNAGLETLKSNRSSRQEGKSSGVVLRTGGDGLHPSCAHFDFNQPLRPERLTASFSTNRAGKRNGL